ncbi:hypothetical protein [Rhizobium lusitanum]|uniref:hypothetical protein n=1 Tax=Rhizobium lusitanum TaxID=293958 RepID=UPI001958413C|nr:hypothetical protein [Rhizobium lusitanum]MBM7045358.1 hypothetical protein [Rhizobium lusitanum]
MNVFVLAQSMGLGSEEALARFEDGQGEISRKFIRLETQMETRMAKIISLSERRSRMPPRAQKEPVEAKILLFTGVRYEHLDTATDRPGAGGKRAKSK